MKEGQILSHRDRDLNTPDQLIRSLGISAAAHLALILAIILTSEWSFRAKPIVPTPYMVSLVTPEKATPHTLLDTPKERAKPPAPEVKEAPKQVKSVKQEPQQIKKKTATAGKKIVPVKEEAKETPPPKKEKAPPAPEPPRPKEPKAPPAPESQPAKTVVTEGTYFPHVWYLKIVERKVNENWITHGIDITGKQADPVVVFAIARDGSVFGLKMERSSGSAPLDQSSIDAVRGSAPFPPLPEDFNGNSLVLHFGFSYEQRE